jgi:hypothetical protein
VTTNTSAAASHRRLRILEPRCCIALQRITADRGWRALTGRARWRTVVAMRCFQCSAVIELASGERVGFHADCDRCGGDLHVCRNCELFDPGAANQCREPQAEPVRDRERANLCEWFRPDPADERATGASPAQAAREALDALFRKGRD